ncbi:MAG: iron ABC transporter permease, partial [Anaerolineaceae bacterium]|nr:iron ABC transporter permease [Anaerolineaceae bacterium]
MCAGWMGNSTPSIQLFTSYNQYYMKPQRSKRIWLWVLPLLFMGLFFYYPLVSVFQRTSAGLAEEGLGSVNAARLIGRALRFTVFQSLLSTLLTLGVGLPAAYLFARFRFAGKRFLHVLITLPFILPTVVVASAFSALLGPNGWLNQVLKAVFDLPQPPIQFLNTLGAILLGHVFYNTAVIIRVVGSSWAQLDPRLENAARSLGASPLRAFLEVTLPLLRPAILAGSLLVFLFDFTSFGVILMLGGPQYATLEVEIYIQAMHMLNLPLAAVLSALQIACTLVLSAGYTRLTGAANIPLIPRLNQSTARFARTAAEKVFVGGMILFLLILLVLPLAALALRSVSVPGAETA